MIGAREPCHGNTTTIEPIWISVACVNTTSKCVGATPVHVGASVNGAHGIAAAQYYLGELYRSGRGVYGMKALGSGEITGSAVGPALLMPAGSGKPRVPIGGRQTIARDGKQLELFLVHVRGEQLRIRLHCIRECAKTGGFPALVMHQRLSEYGHHASARCMLLAQLFDDRFRRRRAREQRLEDEFFFLPFVSPTLGEAGANKPWLQELADPTTTVMWNTWVEINPHTAEELGIEDDDVVRIIGEAGTVEASVYKYPAIRPDTIAMPFGQGHTAYGRYAQGRGVNPLDTLGAHFNEAGKRWNVLEGCFLGDKTADLQIGVQPLCYPANEFQDQPVSIDNGGVALFAPEHRRFECYFRAAPQ